MSAWGKPRGSRGYYGGKRADIGGQYFRSRWEANWARYLTWLLGRGEVVSWEYEVETFEFPVKRGTRFYTPDFRITYPDGRVLFHEVKGYMRPADKTKARRMAKYHPSVEIKMIQAREYEAVKRLFSKTIPNWE